jgi:hypothetical protein
VFRKFVIAGLAYGITDRRPDGAGEWRSHPGPMI